MSLLRRPLFQATVSLNAQNTVTREQDRTLLPPRWVIRQALEALLYALILLVTGCAYDVEKWWEDLAEAECTCVRPGDVDVCVEERMATWEDSEYWHCADDRAPVNRWDVRDWTQEYNTDCTVPDEDPPLPEDPQWYESCES